MNPEHRQQQNVHESESISPYLQEVYYEIENNFKTLDLPKDTKMQAMALLLEIAQKQMRSTQETGAAYYQIQQFLENLNKEEKPSPLSPSEIPPPTREEKMLSFIDTTNRAKLEQSFKLDKEITSEWQQIDQNQITRWQNGTTRLPGSFEAGKYVAFIRIPQAQKSEEPLYFYSLGNESPKAPAGIMGAEIETFQVVKPKLGEKLVLENIGTTSLYDSSEKIKKLISQSFPEIQFDTNFQQEIPQDYWRNTQVLRESSVDGSIQEGQEFVYDYLPLKGSESGLFVGKILGLNNEGNVVVQNRDNGNTFAIERNTWEKLKKLKNNVNRQDSDFKMSGTSSDQARPIIQYANDESELKKLLERAEFQKSRREALSQRLDADPETYKINEEIFYNNLEREIAELKKGVIEPENLVNFILEKTTFRTEAERNDAKAVLTLRFDMLQQTQQKPRKEYGPITQKQDHEETMKILEFVKKIREESQQQLAA